MYRTLAERTRRCRRVRPLGRTELLSTMTALAAEGTAEYLRFDRPSQTRFACKITAGSAFCFAPDHTKPRRRGSGGSVARSLLRGEIDHGKSSQDGRPFQDDGHVQGHRVSQMQ